VETNEALIRKISREKGRAPASRIAGKCIFAQGHRESSGEGIDDRALPFARSRGRNSMTFARFGDHRRSTALLSLHFPTLSISGRYRSTGLRLALGEAPRVKHHPCQTTPSAAAAAAAAAAASIRRTSWSSEAFSDIGRAGNALVNPPPLLSSPIPPSLPRHPPVLPFFLFENDKTRSNVKFIMSITAN